MIIEHPNQLKPEGWDVLLIDPPWQFKVWNRDTGAGRSAEAHYPTLDLGEMKRLPIYDLAAKDSFIFAWVTNSMLPEALDLFGYYGFKFVTVAFTWAKTTKKDKWHFGMGYYTRQNTEMCLLFKKGKPKRASAKVRELLVAQIGEHSAKPFEAYERIEWLVEGDEWHYSEQRQPLARSYLEIYARSIRDGWDQIGNELGSKRDIREVLGVPAEPKGAQDDGKNTESEHDGAHEASTGVSNGRERLSSGAGVGAGAPQQLALEIWDDRNRLARRAARRLGGGPNAKQV